MIIRGQLAVSSPVHPFGQSNVCVLHSPRASNVLSWGEVTPKFHPVPVSRSQPRIWLWTAALWGLDVALHGSVPSEGIHKLAALSHPIYNSTQEQYNIVGTLVQKKEKWKPIAATGWPLSSNPGRQRLQKIPGCAATSLDDSLPSRIVPLGPGCPHFGHSLLCPPWKWAFMVHPSWGCIAFQPTSC